MTRQILALATGIVTLVAMWAAGSGRTWSWSLSLFNQALWVIFIVAFGAWGLVPLTVGLTVVYARNYWKWRARPPATMGG